MSIPFGFSLGDDNNNDDLASFFEQMGQAMRNAGTAKGYVDWESVKNASSKVLKQENDPTVGRDVHEQITRASELANLWLDEATSYPSGGTHCEIMKRSGWIASTFDTWQTIVEPVASGLAQAMTSLMPEGDNALEQGMLAIPEELLNQMPPEIAQQLKDMIGSEDFSNMLKPMMDMARSMSATMFGTQFGEHIGWMSTSVLSATDVGLPLNRDTTPTYIGENVRKFCQELGSSESDAYVYIALREVAHQRLFTHAPWMLTQIQTALGTYARGVKIDTSQIENMINNIDINNLEEVNTELSVELSLLEPTEEQQAAVARIELLLAFIEGWVTTVVLRAANNRLPNALALEETFRRRRAAGGPAERLFKGLIGLELHPRKIREATSMWQKLTDTVGIQERDQLWSHPDLLPTDTDIEDIDAFIKRNTHDIMADLQRAMNSDVPAPQEGSNTTFPNETDSHVTDDDNDDQSSS